MLGGVYYLEVAPGVPQQYSAARRVSFFYSFFGCGNGMKHCFLFLMYFVKRILATFCERSVSFVILLRIQHNYDSESLSIIVDFIWPRSTEECIAVGLM